MSWFILNGVLLNPANILSIEKKTSEGEWNILVMSSANKELTIMCESEGSRDEVFLKISRFLGVHEN